MHPDLPPALLRALPGPLVQAYPLQGGDIARAWKLELADGRAFFAKTLPDAPPGLFAAEARGLRWLGDANAISVPHVLAASGPRQAGGFLLLPFIAEHPAPAPHAHERLGRLLAALHATAAPCWGAAEDGFIGRLPQRNGGGSCTSWPAFFHEFRLLPQLQAAELADRLTTNNRRRLVRLMGSLPDLLATDASPVCVHGDLWHGNVLIDETGDPWLVDPAAYGGHPEVDLAMMSLFGGFPDRVYDAYAEVAPLEPGWADRRTVFQLYPVLVHLNLFGPQYNGHLEHLLEHLR